MYIIDYVDIVLSYTGWLVTNYIKSYTGSVKKEGSWKKKVSNSLVTLNV